MIFLTLLFSILVIMPTSLLARTATNQEELQAEAQLQGTKGDLGEKAIQKEESLDIDPKIEEKTSLEPDIIKNEEPNEDE